LVSEPDLQSAQSTLLSEIQPEVNSLLTRVEAYLDKLDRREQSLIAKCELQRGRLSSSNSNAKKEKTTSSTSAAGGATVSAIKMSQARQKKERLSYAIDRLQLQAQQKERQLRKSLAAPPAKD
jgi:DASH complex subunit SPC19